MLVESFWAAPLLLAKWHVTVRHLADKILGWHDCVHVIWPTDIWSTQHLPETAVDPTVARQVSFRLCRQNACRPNVFQWKGMAPFEQQWNIRAELFSRCASQSDPPHSGLIKSNLNLVGLHSKNFYKSLHRKFLGTSDERLMNYWWASYELLMSILWTSDEHLMNFWWVSYELLMSILWTCGNCLMNFWRVSYELLMSVLWTSYDLLMIILWTSYEYFKNL